MKYFKPKSLTWWSSCAPLIAGVLVAFEPLHGWTDVTATINSVTGFVSPSIMINAGLLGIGFRAAIK
tara:strand:- start:1181 stop:1381 length:201 start_codon:yes stop_codon:yes gene_type:complete